MDNEEMIKSNSDEQSKNSESVSVEDVAEVNDAPGAEAAEGSADEDESSSSGLFSKLQKRRQERMEAVGSDDDYDIFDLQELMDIPADDEIFDEEKSGDEKSLLDELEGGPDAEEEIDPLDRRFGKKKKGSLFSRLKKSREAKKEESEEERSDVSDEETHSAEADGADEAPAEPEDQPDEAVEASPEARAEPEVSVEAEAEPEPKKEEEYVSPLVEMESFEKDKYSALNDLNKTLMAAGIGEIDIPAEHAEETPESIEKEIDGLFDDQLKVVPDGKTKVVTEKKNEFSVMPERSEDENEPEQIQLDEYDAESIEPEIVDEKEEELRLERKRKGWIEKFRLNVNPDESEPYVEPKTEGTADITEDVELEDGENVFEAVERTSGDKKSLLDALKLRLEKKEEEEHLISISEVISRIAKDKKRLSIALIAEGVIGLALLVFAFIGSSFDESGAANGLFAHGGRAFVLINLILYAVGAGFAFSSFKKAFERLRAGYIDSRAVFLCLNAVVVFEMLLALCAGLNENSGFIVYAFSGVFSIIAELLSEKVNCDSLSKSLAVLTKSRLRGIRPIEKKEESAVLGYDLAANGDPSIYYSTDVRLPENIAYLSENTSKEQGLSKLSIIIPAAVGLILSVIVCVLRKSAMPLITVPPCALCLCLPVFRPLVLSIFKSDANKGSIINGVSVLSYDDCDEVARANAVVLDASELLGVTVSDFRKMKGAGMTKSDTAVYTAAVLKKSGSMLSSCFDSFIENSGIDLPDAEDLSYEQGLGFSAWVGGARVIVGTRKCIELHSIPCPTEEQEKAYSPDAYVLYTCVEDRIVATFKATYLPRRSAKKQIDALRRSGIVVMLSSAEPSLSDEEAAEILHCSVAMTKIISTNGREIIAANRAAGSSESNGVFSVRKKRSVLLAVAEAYNLSIRRRTSRIGSLISSFVLAAVYAVCGILGFSVAFSPVTVVLFSAAAAAVTYVIGRFSNK